MFTIKDLKLAAISTEEMIDEAVEIIFLDTVIKSKDDIYEAIAILKKHRPMLLDKIEWEVFGRKK